MLQSGSFKFLNFIQIRINYNTENDKKTAFSDRNLQNS